MSRETTQEAKETQRNFNTETLKMLIKAGSDVTKPHVIENFFHAVNPSKVNAMTQTLNQHGYRTIRSDHEAAPKSHLMVIEADWVTVPTEDNLGKMTDLGVEIADAFGCDYDGWGTEAIEN